MQIDTQGSNTMSMNAHRAKQKHQVAGQTNEYDLMASDLLNKDSCEALNLEEKHHVSTVMLANPDDKWVSSDADADEDADDPGQIIFKVVFSNPARLTHVLLRASNGPDGASGPRTVKLYANQDSFDFSNVDDPCSQKLELTAEQIKSGAKVPLKQIKFNSVLNLAVFIEDNQGDTDVTFLNRLGIMGRPVNMYHTEYE